MSTLATYGFTKNNIEKTLNCYSDGYIENCGKNVVLFIKTHSIFEMNEMFDNIKIIDNYNCDIDDINNDFLFKFDNIKKQYVHNQKLGGIDYLYLINLDKNSLDVYARYKSNINNNSERNGYDYLYPLKKFTSLTFQYIYENKLYEIINNLLEEKNNYKIKN